MNANTITSITILLVLGLFSTTTCFHVGSIHVISTSRSSTTITAITTTTTPTIQSSAPPFKKVSFPRTNIIMMGQRSKRIKKEIKEERQMETPPRIQTPYGPIRYNRPLSICETCQGRGVVRCNVCDGRGVIRATGHRKRNALNTNRVNGSRWTAVEIRSGHRHYVVSEVRGSRKKKNFELRMSNSCGPEEKRVHLWISEEEIRNKQHWRMGWVTLEEIRIADKGPLIDAKVCFRCKGKRVLKCIDCDGTGAKGHHQILHD